MMLHICGGASRWARRVVRCPICKRRRRCLSSFSFGGYCSTLICGGCGNQNDDLDGFRRMGKRARRENIETVRSQWRTARTKAEELAEVRAHIDAKEGA